MLYFSHATPLFRRAGLGIALAQLSVFIFAFPPFQGGVWLQIEPVMTAIFTLCALNVLWMALGIYNGQLRFGTWHPVWIIAAFWVGWQWLATYVSPSPWRAWFGPPQLGEGTAWWTAWMFCALLMHSLWRCAHYRHVLVCVAVFNLLFLSLMHAVTAPGEEGTISPWQPAAWPDYLVFMVGYVWLIFMSGAYAKKPFLLVLLLIVSFTTLLLSDNRSGILLFLLPMAFTVILHGSPRIRTFFSPHTYWRTIALGVCLLPLLWIAFCFYYPQTQDAKTESSYLASLIAEKNGGLGSRVAMARVAMHAASHEPERLVFGRGWGNYNDVLFSYALLDDVKLFTNNLQRVSWGLINGVTFHSHNQPLEALLSLGVPGLLLWLALPLAIIAYLPGRYFWRITPMLIAVCALGYLWFQLPQLIAFHALAWAAMGHLCTKPSIANTRPYGSACGMAIAIVMAWSAWAQSAAMREGSLIHDALTQNKPAENYPLNLLNNDAKRGGDRLQSAAQNFVIDLIVRSKEGRVTPNDAAWLSLLLQSADHLVASTGPSFSRPAYVAMWIRFRLLADIDGGIFSDLRHTATASLTDSVMEATRRAPLRDDAAMIFLMNLDAFTHHDIGLETDILRKMLALAPEHRGALWVMGKLLAGDPQTRAAGIDMQKHAVELGAANVFPISYDEIRALESTR